MKKLATFISVLFHPLLFPSYGTLLILAANPDLFGAFGEKIHIVWLIIVFVLTFLFPVIWLLMMKKLEMISSLHLETASERIIPFVAVATFYLWTAWMFKPNVNMKIPTNIFVFYMMLGSCLAIFSSFFINIFSKISLHALGTGNLIGLMLIVIRQSPYDLRWAVPACILLAGLVGTARLFLKAHNTNQIFAGYFVGFTAQFLAFSIAPFIFSH
jgi:hypothetical protein